MATSDLVLVAANFGVMLLWAVFAQRSLEALSTGRESGPISRLHPPLTATLAVVYFLAALLPLRPMRPDVPPSLADLYLYAANDIGGFLAVALFRHMTWYFHADARAPSRTWLAFNYGSAAVFAVIALVYPLIVRESGPNSLSAYGFITWVYLFAMLGSGLRRLAFRAREGRWRAGGFAQSARPDVAVLSAGLVLLVVAMLIVVTGVWLEHTQLLSWVMTLFGLVCFLPFAVRMLGSLIRDVLVLLGMLGAMAVWTWASFLVSRGFDPAAQTPALVLLTSTGLVGILSTLQPWLRWFLDALLFGRSHGQHAELQRFFHTLSPELGAETCARRALDELVRVLQLRGAALQFRDGGAVVAGAFSVEPLERVWPRAEAAEHLIDRTLLGVEVSILPDELREARVEAGVVAVVAARGSRRLWAHLLLTTTLVGASLREEDLRAIEAFADQLGLLFDGAELLARAVGVERSLAHAEKLAAIGELTARIAHEIRNPVTAARSLAQQLAREPSSPYVEEHQLILTELERIERQVSDLLRFARREELRFEPLDLSELVRQTAQDLRPSLSSSGIELRVAANGAAVGRGDRERLRQVVINLVENARDALEEASAQGCIRLEVEASNGLLTLDVTDDGPGIAEDALTHLFEPFFSTKVGGTGLGLAIVKRTIEAHGGTIEARRRVAGGMRFRIELPSSNESRENP